MRSLRLTLVGFLLVALTTACSFGGDAVGSAFRDDATTALKATSGVEKVDLAESKESGTRYLRGTVTLSGAAGTEADDQLDACLQALAALIAKDDTLKKTVNVAVKWRTTGGDVVSVKDLGLNPNPTGYDLVAKYGGGS